MKAILALSVLLASSAFAKPVAKVTTSGGFTPFPRSTTLTVDDSGSVTVETITYAHYNVDAQKVVETIQVAQLNPSIVAKLISDVAEANNSTLVAEDPEAPECMDAPSTVYSALKGGVFVKIGKRVSCKSYSLDDYQGRTAMGILENLLHLSYNAE